MRERLIWLATRLYPASWRRRYGIEFEALLEDTARDRRDVADVLLGALKMQMTTWGFGRIAAGFGVAGALLCGGMSFVLLPDQYTSYCVLRLTRSQLSGDQQSMDNSESVVTGLMQDTLSRTSLAGVIEKHGLYPRERAREPMEDVIDRMRRDVRFDRLGHTSAFHMAFRYTDAEQARRTEQELINKLMAANVTIRRADLNATNHRLAYNLEVLDPATLPKRPSSPNRLVIAAMGLAGGLLLGIAAAAIARARAVADPGGSSPKSS
jgi:hypothetical protein